MDFYVHDNMENYNNLFVYEGYEKTRIEVQDIYIPESRAFWFRTDYPIIEKNVNLNSRYLHIHPGLTRFDKMNFDKEPHVVKRSELVFNPKTNHIEITVPKSFFRKEKLFSKLAVYRGTVKPKNTTPILGSIIFDWSNKTMHFILNYYPHGRKIRFQWEDTEEEPTMEQKMRIKILEEQIAEKEKILSSASTDGRVNLS